MSKKLSSNEIVLEVLRSELSRRLELNPSYSQRAFAKHLGVSHTLLSLIMNEKRAPSKVITQKLLEIAKLPKSKTDALLKLTNAKTYKEAKERSFHKINLDQFSLISEWQHYAILSLLEVEDTVFAPEFISKRLGISPLNAKISMQRLIELHIIEQLPSGKWKQKSGPIIVENANSTLATRKFQKQLLNKAIESLENDPIEVRDISSTTFAMAPKKIPYALKRIREFRRELSSELESFEEAEEVYNLTVQIFPTSRRKS
jgi:uncharacterized protein (TIGR02147 family)